MELNVVRVSRPSETIHLAVRRGECLGGLFGQFELYLGQRPVLRLDGQCVPWIESDMRVVAETIGTSIAQSVYEDF